MKNISKNLTLAILLASAALAGCANKTPHLDDKFGLAVNSAKALQTINPDASLNTDPVAGIGGKAAAAVIDNYHNSYKAPPAAARVGTGGSSGGR